MPAMKPDGSVRLCRKNKVNVTNVFRLNAHSSPRIEKVENKLAGEKTFTELDYLSHAYELMALDEVPKNWQR